MLYLKRVMHPVVLYRTFSENADIFFGAFRSKFSELQTICCFSTIFVKFVQILNFFCVISLSGSKWLGFVTVETFV